MLHHNHNGPDFHAGSRHGADDTTTCRRRGAHIVRQVPQCGRKNATTGSATHVRKHDGAGDQSYSEAADEHRDTHRAVAFDGPEGWRVPESPNQRNDECALQRAVPILQNGKRESAPSDFLAEAIEDQNERQHGDQGQRRQPREQREVGPARRPVKQPRDEQRQPKEAEGAEGIRPELRGRARDEPKPPRQSAESRSSGDKGRRDDARDRRTEQAGKVRYGSARRDRESAQREWNPVGP